MKDLTKIVNLNNQLLALQVEMYYTKVKEFYHAILQKQLRDIRIHKNHSKEYFKEVI